MKRIITILTKENLLGIGTVIFLNGTTVQKYVQRQQSFDF